MKINLENIFFPKKEWCAGFDNKQNKYKIYLEKKNETIFINDDA